MIWITFRKMIHHAQRMFGFESYWYTGTVARQSLKKHRVSRRACVCYVNWASGKFTEQEIADQIGITQQTVMSMIETVRKVWRHLPGKPPTIPKLHEIVPLDLEQHNESIIAKW